MNLSKYLGDDQVIVGLRVGDKSALIDRLLEALARGPLYELNPELSRERVAEAVRARESERATVVGGGTACPHARIPGLQGVGVAVAVLGEPVDFGGGAPVDLAVLLVLPAERPPLGLKLIANVAGLARSEQRAPLFQARSAVEAAEYFRQAALNIEAPLRARDFMRAPFCFLTTETPVTEVVRKMVEFNVDAMGILDESGALVGEITSDKLFMLGVPDFFSQLKSVSFILEFDPFDRYFAQEAHQKAGEVMSTDVARVEEDATVLEVIFLLAVKRHAKVYVVRDGKLSGIIDRARVLNEILKI